MGWAAIFLVVIFAFILIPTHERFTDAQGRYTDVSPNAPARPSWMAAPTTDAIVQPGSIRPIDSSTAYSRTAPPVTVLGAPTSNMGSAPVVVGAGGGSGAGSTPSSNLSLLSSPTAAAPRITSTLGTANPSISGMNSAYTSGVIPPTGSPWPGLQTFTEMAAEVTNPAFQAQRHPTPPLGTLASTTPDTGLFGPGPNVLRKNLVACTCASQAAGCSVHPRQ
jgi:hypothetical protein